MNITLSKLVERLGDRSLSETNVIPWSSPVPSFGDVSRSRVATLGLNPSNREFVDALGNELEGSLRRFHTLQSLRLTRWSDVSARQLRLILDSCRAYFFTNPYRTWFGRLDHLISGTKASFYDRSATACHLDLIPYATSCKWIELTSCQRSLLFAMGGDTLGSLLRDSPIRVLILNGKSVVEHFQRINSIHLEKETMEEWSLPRRGASPVPGVAYSGVVRVLSGVSLQRDVLVLGFNHNIQSSFGVTTRVIESIRRWIARTADHALP
jgi:hypothetical protein